MKLYSYWRSSSSWRVRIGLHHKRVPFEYHAVHLLKDGGQQNTETYRELNPTRMVPLLELEEGGKPVRISQSLAILEFLEERFPSPALLPKAPLARAHVREMAEAVNASIQPLQNLAVLQHVKRELHGDDKAWARHWVSRGLEALERLVAAHGGKFCFGDEVTLADICLIPQLYSSRRFAVDLSPYPSLTRVESACENLPAFQAAHASVQPDAEAAPLTP